MQLGSRYSMRIYELLKMREDLRWLRIPVQQLRELLSCEDKYSRFGDFRRRVIDRAQSEIEESTDVSFTYKVEREGQSPVRINFMIAPEDGSASEIRPVEATQNEGLQDISIEAGGPENGEGSDDIQFNPWLC